MIDAGEGFRSAGPKGGATDRHMNREIDDDAELHCRMLGHAVPFRYCRSATEGLPCRLVQECWQGRFDVHAFLQARYTPEQIQEILAPSKPKLASIVELIEQARARNATPDPP